jgi:phosphoribosylanthranilate isomerase
MTWVKICGTTNLEDALMAVDAGADALGFVFYEQSPRYVEPEVAQKIVAHLPSGVEKVGVFVHHAADRAMQIAERCGLTALQFQLQPLPMAAPPASTELRAVAGGRWKTYLALPASWFLGDAPVRADLASFTTPRPERPFDTIFLDSGTPQQPGGTGVTFDWAKAAPLVATMRECVKVVIAGGLTSTNVAEAMRILHPWGVDVASGVEARPGKKDPEKVRAFVAAVRTAEMTR